MENQLNDRLIFPKSLTVVGDLLNKISECSLFTFSVKDIKTRRIVLHNKECAKVWGLEKVGLAGRTSRECLEQVTGFVNIENVLKRFEQEEARAIIKNSIQTRVITILDYEGFVRIRQHLTLPVCGSRNQTLAIAAICHDRTSYAHLLYLFNGYRKYYTKSKAAVKFSKYLRLDTYFYAELTYGELSVLLALVQAPKHKQAAHLLTDFRKKPISSTTVSNYVDLLKNKLKISIDLDMVLSHIRGLGQWIPEHVTY